MPNLSRKNRLYGIERFSSIFCVKNDRSCKKVWWPLEQIAVKMHNANTCHSGWIALLFFWKIVANILAVAAKLYITAMLRQLCYSSCPNTAMLCQLCLGNYATVSEKPPEVTQVIAIQKLTLLKKNKKTRQQQENYGPMRLQLRLHNLKILISEWLGN